MSDLPPPPPTDQRQQLLAQLLDLLPDYFYVHTYDLRFVYANQRAADYLGLSKAEMIGQPINTITIDEAQRQLHTDLAQQIMRDGQPSISDRLPFRRPDGKPGYLRQHGIPFTHPETGELMLMGIARDITDEIELLDRREELAALHREMHIAKEIQQSLRPEPLRSSFLHLSGLSEAAVYAGGDFYDWRPLNDGSVVVTLGDVTGHGIGPALLAAECRAYWRVLVETLPLRAAVLRLNELLSKSLSGGRFVTLVAAKISPDGSVELFSAGHGPILLRRSAGTVDRLTAHAPPIGVFYDDSVGESTHHFLAPGDALLLISDGITELRNADGEQWGESELIRTLRTHLALHGDELLAAIDRDNLAFAAGAAAADDRTLVIATQGSC